MFRQLLLIPCIIAIVGIAATNAYGKGGPGKGGGGGRKSAGMRSARGAPSHAPRTSHPLRGQMHKPAHQTFAHSTNKPTRAAANSVGDHRRLVESQKLTHRQQVADHLRQVADKNGNSQLHDVADRMDKKAQEHYDKQMRKLDGAPVADDQAVDFSDIEHGSSDVFDGSVPLTEASSTEGELAAPEDVPFPTDTDNFGNAQIADKLTGRQNALYRQLRNEERKLAKRMEGAEQLRRLAETNGDPALLESADRLEESALDHYTRRLAKISEFQSKFGLTVPDSTTTLPTSLEP